VSADPAAKSPIGFAWDEWAQQWAQAASHARPHLAETRIIYCLGGVAERSNAAVL
jgi:hypothetical protein